VLLLQLLHLLLVLFLSLGKFLAPRVDCLGQTLLRASALFLVDLLQVGESGLRVRLAQAGILLSLSLRLSQVMLESSHLRLVAADQLRLFLLKVRFNLHQLVFVLLL